eukprot:TRINITY_DN9169_c0_g1_i1.p2 TRINITY_DN9169_c0_g1~~TRINITY_DN9169_c0_g1_i1.p2  ORF type:complete len:335 (-),score=100.52 TRINITY_DN9169_c0_g1_i1:438-1442(-)
MAGKRAIVLGAGVIGLTSALKLLESGWEVKIYGDKIMSETTSGGIAAWWEPYLSQPEDKVFVWAQMALKDFLAIQHDRAAGIEWRDSYEFVAKEWPVKPRWLQLLRHRNVEKSEIPSGYKDGVWYRSFLIEMQRFLPWLLARIGEHGGVLERRTVKSLDELAHDPFAPHVVVNCCGLGAFELLGDKDVYPLRGQVVRVHAPHVKETRFGTTANGELAYIIPRTDFCVLGGTADKGNWNTEPDAAVAREILQRCDVLHPGISKSPILGSWVGLRPGRTSIRVERETLTSKAGRKYTVVHNYGHGGSGATLSFGCATDVARLANESWESQNVPSKL